LKNALKGLLAGLVVLVLCSPLMLWPADEAEVSGLQLSEVTVTIPSPVLVTATLVPSESSTTTTSEALAQAPPSTTTTTTTEPPISVTIAAVGDVLPHESIVRSVEDPGTGSYDFRPIFAPVAPYLVGADYAVANLETRLAGKQFGYSGYPVLNSPESLAYALGSSGFDLVATANNHCLDMGWQGVVNTLDVLDRYGLAHVGTYRSPEERKTPLVVNLQGIRVAFLNYATDLNGLALPEEQQDYAVSLLALDRVAQDAMLARTWGADVVIAIVHWGTEYEREPNEAQRRVAGDMLSRGVDVILGAHPHVVQPIDHVFDFESWRVSDKYVAYSLGNFVSAQRWRYSDSGLIAFVHLEKQGLRTRVTGLSYLPVYVQRDTSGSVAKYRVLPVLPGLEPETDVVLTEADRSRMAQVWEELRAVLYRPDEDIVPLDPAQLGLR